MSQVTHVNSMSQVTDVYSEVGAPPRDTMTGQTWTCLCVGQRSRSLSPVQSKFTGPNIGILTDGS